MDKIEEKCFIDNLDFYTDELKFEGFKKIKYSLEAKEKVISSIKDTAILERALVYWANDKITGWNYHWDQVLNVIERVSKRRKIDIKELIKKIYADNEKFNESDLNILSNISEKIKLGIEIEADNCTFTSIKKLYKMQVLESLCKELEIPNNIFEEISKARFIEEEQLKKHVKYNVWNFSKEANQNEKPEASSPILTKEKEKIGQISAMCLILKALGADVSNSQDCGLHINIAADYLECNEKAVEYLIDIWKEAEELFFIISNDKSRNTRRIAKFMAKPIKENLVDIFEQDGSVNINSEEELEAFIHKIAGNNEQGSKEKSINFNNMRWNNKDAGRIEFRLFNSTLDSKILLENILLVARLIETSLELAKNKEYKKEIYKQFQRHDITEKEKVILLLNLLFDDKESKIVFFERWKSKKNKQLMYEYLDFGKTSTFCREDGR